MSQGNKNVVMKAIDVVKQGGVHYPAMTLVNDNPELAAVMSKLVTPQIRPSYGANGQRLMPNPSNTEFKTISHKRARAINDSETVMQLLPDMELSAQILCSSILSPKDMMAVDLNFIPPEGVLNSQTTAALVQVVRTHFDQLYKIKPELGKILRKMLFETGSHPLVVLPENSLDEVINRNTNITMESLSSFIDPVTQKVRSVGILGPRTKPKVSTPGTFGGISLENFQSYTKADGVGAVQIQLNPASQELVSLECLVVSDNVNALKFPYVEQRLREQRLSGAIGSNMMLINPTLKTSLEGLYDNSHPRSQVQRGGSIQGFNDAELSGLLYKAKPSGYTPIMMLKTDGQLQRRSVGAPLVMELPSEAVIPVHMPGHPNKHIGFFVMVDANGNPLSKDTNKDYYSELQDRLNGTTGGSFQSGLLSRLKSSMNGFNCAERDHIDYSARVYAEMVEQDLLARLRNGIYANGVALAKNEEIFRIMLARTLAGQQTQLLFIPVEQMTYFAFKYNDDGTGKSLLEDMKMINSLRAMLMFSNVMASVRNSIGRRVVNLKFDESDPDPMKTAELMINEIVRSNQQSFPLGASSPVDIVDYLQRAAMEFAYEGHPGMPDVKVDFSEKQSSFAKADTELEDNLRKRSINHVGLAPEMIDASQGPDFATTVVNNSIMLARRVMQLQDEFTPLLMDHFRKVIKATPALIKELRQIVVDNFDSNQERLTDDEKKRFEGPEARDFGINQLLLDFVNGLEVQLPRPNTVTLENQEKAFDTYVNMLDKVIEAYISDKFFTEDIGGEVATNVLTIKEVVRSYFIRQWLAENGVMPELAKITTTDEDGRPEVNFWDDNEQHLANLTKTMTHFMVRVQPPKNEGDETLQANGVPPGTGGGGFGGGGDMGMQGGGGGGADDFGMGGGMDDFGGGDLTGLDEIPSGNTNGQKSDPNPDEETDAEAGGNPLL